MADESLGVRVHGLVADGAVRLLLVEARAIAEHARRSHGLGSGASRLAGDGVVAGLLLAAHIKGEEQITLQLQGSEPRSSMYVDVTAEGDVRARVTPADLHLDERAAVSGILVAVKHIGRKELYRGATEVADASVEQALAEHLVTSNQVDALIRVAVVQGPEGEILQAGGLLLERLPEEAEQPSVTPAEFAERFGWVREADPTQLMTQLAFGVLGDEKLTVLESTQLRWQCRCSLERIEATLAALGPDPLQEMIDEDHGAEVTCNFCNTVYRLDEARLRELAER